VIGAYVRNEHGRLCLQQCDGKIVELLDGPWHTEPDRVDFRCEGFACLALRGPLGAWCGYIAMPPGHPWRTTDPEGLPVEINYASPCNGEVCHVAEPGEPDDVLWLGFDCAHAGDMTLRRALPGDRETYRTLEFCQQHLNTLATRARADMTMAA
jgi:hypothetical protein